MTLLTMLQRKKHQMKMHQVRRKAPQAAFHHENVVLLQKPRGERERTESVTTVAVVAVIAVVATTTAIVVIMIAIATTIAVTTAVTTTNTAATTIAITVAITIVTMIAIIAAITAAAVTRDPRAVTELLSALVSEVTAEVVAQYMLVQVPPVLAMAAMDVVAVVDADVVQDMALELLVELLELVSVLEPSTPDWELAVIAHVEPQQPFIMYH